MALRIVYRHAIGIGGDQAQAPAETLVDLHGEGVVFGVAHIFDCLNECIVAERKMRGSASYGRGNSLVLIPEAGEVMAYRPEIPDFHRPTSAELALDVKHVLQGIRRVVEGVVGVGVRRPDRHCCAAG